MKPNELIVGSYYVRAEKSLILHFYGASPDGLARYHAYDLSTGKFRFTSSCELGSIIVWADRKATVEEIGRVHREYTEEVDTPTGGIFERRSRPLREVLRRTRPDRW